MTSDDTEYFRRRAPEEREAASRASEQYLAEIHLELAGLMMRWPSSLNCAPTHPRGVRLHGSRARRSYIQGFGVKASDVTRTRLDRIAPFSSLVFD